MVETTVSQFWYRPRYSRLRGWIFQVHLYCGLALAILATVIGVTGSYIVYKPEMERLSAGAISKVDPAGESRPLSELFQLAQRATSKKVERLYIWGGPRAAWVFRASRDGREREYIYVDQYRGRVQGTYPMDGTFLQWMYDLHSYILMGHGGLIANGAGALLMCLMCLTGAVVWWPGARRLRYGFRYHWQASWKGQNYDVHKVLGIASLLLLAIIAFTGASYAFPDTFRGMFSALTLSSAVAPGNPPSHLRMGVAPVSADVIFRVARNVVPGAELTILTWPADAKGSFVARERLHGDWSRLGDQYIYVDQYDASIVRADLSRRAPRAARIMLTMSPLHYGTFAGTPTRWLWILMGLVPGILSVTGVLMWWNRVVVRKLTAPREARLPVPAMSAEKRWLS
jgi:uncharacterized iron-regulated membrane protein